MANAKIDQNRNKVGLAIDNSGNTLPLKVDPSTGRLLVEITHTSDTTPVLADEAKIDENRAKAALATDGTNKRPLLIDGATGYLFCDVVIE